ncbi:MAG: HPr(Ser) kinase/phosphatase [Candidatus Hydrogenedentota bacterium]|nr:MAG: HPr(Ser) kinase/phosphatase [Candidatus Hydrogenedentota bacterium]
MVDLAEAIDPEVLVAEEGLRRPIFGEELHRPGLALAGFLEYFRPENLQILGMTELSYLKSLEPEVRRERVAAFLEKGPPAVFISRSLAVPDELIETAAKVRIPVIRSPLMTEELRHRVELYLERRLNPNKIVHGVLMDVFGVGVLITGESGVGKSETALELVKRGHRLVSDDVVQVRRIRYDRLVGTSPEITRHQIEIRGLGIINVRQLYGATAVTEEMMIDLVAQLEPWDEEREYDRLGLENETVTILDLPVPRVTVPVRPGRNLAVIIEAGAMNQRLKNMGVDAAQEFSERLEGVLKEEQ